MFDKILIANRGEIACRVIKTARRLGIETVAVYSEADAGTLHVEMADEAIAIGPAPSAESYLVQERIIEACKASGAQALHPGFGFLSENAGFVDALEAAGIVFIGPPTGAIRAMGDKIESKRLAAEAGVATVPGHMGLIADDEEAIAISREIGYPVMIKASAGGGGKGMRVARSDEEAREGYRSAQNEARASFADDRIFIEKFIEQPRHIEIQVLADAHGKVIHLGERECSIQRRHQKVIEEAPSPFLDEGTREAMGAQAVALAKAVDYRSAGTVEFIVDAERNFYFLEMNTRIQVEHPVTELITGLDLVEWMIRVAAGEPLSLDQADVQLKGWALECRIYAEDPFRGFLPSIGRLTRYLPPPEGESVRVDSGVVEGSEISMFYDPMIAKLVTHGADRDACIARMRGALDAFCIAGVGHNIPFLASVLAKPRFVAGELTTNFIDEVYPDGFHADDLPPEDPSVLVAVAAAVHQSAYDREAQISGQLDGHGKRARNEWIVRLGEGDHEVTVTALERGCLVAVDGREMEVYSDDWRFGMRLWTGVVDGREIVVQIERQGIGYRLFHNGALVEARALTPSTAALAAQMPRKEPPDLSRFLLSPMPGLLVSLAVAEGQEVKAGDELAVIEAMKMENILRAERDGRVAKLHAGPGDSLAVDQEILEFD